MLPSTAQAGQIRCRDSLPRCETPPQQRSPRGRSHTARAGAASRLSRDTPPPQADVAKLPQTDAAADEVLVGVQKQVQQMLVGRHGEKTVGFDGIEVGKEVVQFVM